MTRVARPYAVVGVVAALVGAFGAITLRIADPAPIIPGSFGFGNVALVGFEVLGLTFASVGALLVVRRPENAVGWCMVLIGDGYALAGLTAVVTLSAVADGPSGAATAGLAGWLTVFFTTIGGLVFVLGLIFPTGRGHTSMWDRLLKVMAITWPGLAIVLFLIRPGPLHVFGTIDNPFGIGPDLRIFFGPQMSSVIAGASVLFVPFLGWSIVSRYRMSDSVGRQQLKWFILALVVALGGVVLAGFGGLVSGNEPPEVGLAVFGFAGALVPVAIGIAILRYRLYDIDRIISRTLSYGAVTAVLALVFGLVGGGLGIVLGQLAEGQTIAVAGSTLLVVALFGPLRRRAHTIVDRRFDRARYDAERTAAAFSERLRDEVNIDTVETDLCDTVHAAIKPTQMSVWLRATIR